MILRIPEFISDALLSDKKFKIIKAGRRTGKTYNAIAVCIAKLLATPNTSMLHVDTTQDNLRKYQQRYYKKQLGQYFPYPDWKGEQYKPTFTLANGSYIDFGSAERPENLEGFGYDIILLNEAGIILKNENLWFNTLLPMTQKSKDVYIIGTPKGKNLFKTLYDTQAPDYVSYTFSAYDSPYWDDEQLEQIKSKVPAYIWKQEYLAEFIDAYENSILEYEDLRFYDYLNLDDFDNIYMHADTTHTGKETSDFFSIVAIGENKKDKNFYVIDFILQKVDVEKQARSSIVMYQKFQNKIKKFTYDEKSNQGFGFWIKKLAKEEYNLSLPIVELKYSKDKVTHFTPHVPHFKANRVYLPNNHPQITTATDQLLAFPLKGVHDDFVDGISGAMDNFNQLSTAYNVSFFGLGDDDLDD